jgi:hypothetical protein
MPPTPESKYQPKKKVDACPYCKVSFGLTIWKYHCGWCGSVVCDNCSPKTFHLPPVHPESIRVCDKCVTEASNYAAEHQPRGTTGGRVLGGGTERGSEEEEREKRAKIIADRMKKNALPSRQTSAFAEGSDKEAQIRIREEIRRRDEERERQALAAKKAAVLPPVVAEVAPAAEATSSTPPKTSPEPEPIARQPSSDGPGGEGRKTNPALEAMLRRQQQSAGSRPNAGPQDPEKAKLLRIIGEKLKIRNEEEPFGLRSMDVAKLRIYLRHLEGGR